ncbi:ABC transporter permease [Rhizobium sp. ICMP 5592]|uniref:ABC transporter permease n=1 Tax=Rhizobium sp. ICMP 5592 TaxID=2292445 RepID=UPI001296D2A6|nr:ABC transporter permease [Rhizobium sp. ICMP 5592]MQB45472.1 ABC transporter permease [Rhizobium sp. ICMP 5592]
MAQHASNLMIAAVLFFLVLPTLLVIPLALSDASYITFPPQGLTLRWFEAYLSDPDWLRSTIFSLQIAAVTAVVATTIGTMAAVALVRGKLPGKALLQALCLGPMIVPAIVFGVALYLVFSPLQLTGNLTGFVLAHSVLAVPFVVIIVSAALERIDPLLELAALSCGAGRLRAFFAVTLPNLAPAVATAAVFAFLTSFDEATVAFFISDTGGKTISRKMFEDIDFNLTPVIAAISVIIVAVSLLLMGSIHLLNGRREQH